MKNKILNPANYITAFRAVLGFLSIYLLYLKDIFVGITLYLVFITLDALDGYTARKLDCETLFGKNFDIVTDVLVSGGIVGYLIEERVIPKMYWWLILAPAILYIVATIKGMIKERKTLVYPKWKVGNAIYFYSTFFFFLLNAPWASGVAYSMVPYFYIASAKYYSES